MNTRTLKILFVTVILIFGAGVIILGTHDRIELMKNHSVTSGIITNCNVGSKGNAGTLFINFSFYVQHKKYNGSTAFKLAELDIDDCNNYFYHKKFPIVYNLERPFNSRLILIPNDFYKFGYRFPDSLKWILKYVKKDFSQQGGSEWDHNDREQ